MPLPGPPLIGIFGATIQDTTCAGAVALEGLVITVHIPPTLQRRISKKRLFPVQEDREKLAKKPKIVSSHDINITNNISGCNIQFFDFKKICFDQTITSHLSAGMPGVCDQLQKVCPNPNKAGRIPGFSAEFRFRDPKATPGEDKGYSTGCTNPVKAWPLDGQRTLLAAREVKRGHMGNSPSAAVLQKSSTRPSPSVTQWPSGIRGGNLFTARIKGGASLMGGASHPLEWEDHCPTQTDNYD